MILVKTPVINPSYSLVKQMSDYNYFWFTYVYLNVKATQMMMMIINTSGWRQGSQCGIYGEQSGTRATFSMGNLDFPFHQNLSNTDL
jgi:hypothetical protein